MAYNPMLKHLRNKPNKQRFCAKSQTPTQAKQVHEQYLEKAHESLTAGDHIAAETCYQYAEHYLRLLNDSKPTASGYV